MNDNKTVLPKQVSVVICGYGPVGAALACLLGRYGVRTLVIDKADDILRHPRAIALDNEALRILQMAGLAEDAFDTVAIPQVKMHCPYLGEFARVNTAGSIDGHPKLVTFFQPDLESALRKRVDELPMVTAITGVSVKSFQDKGAYVVAIVQDKAGELHEVRCDYLVGADGASSMIRDAIGEAFEGRTYQQDWLIVDARNVGTPIDHVEFICDHRRPTPHMVAPGNRQRWEFMLQRGETAEVMLQDDTVRELLRPWSGDQLVEIERKAVYRFHSRCARQFSKGRVFLAGDAAHITPPFVGQGLVAGLRDVANLAWKLAWVVDGLAGQAVLDSYSVERRPHAAAMIRLARLMGTLVMPANAALSLVIHSVMRSTRVFAPIRRYFEELEIKPANAFRSGLFAKRRAGQRRPGSWFPQGWVRTRDGEVCASDDVLGERFVLLGLGVDPLAQVSERHLSAFEQAGGVCIHIARRGQVLGRALAVEDITDDLVSGSPSAGSLVLVRPDRVVMAAGDAASADTLINEALALLNAPTQHTSLNIQHKVA
ncbi:MAG: bifunctional 3-(3-hydroxy-phenyl)propionate/3-hydroxycinnamic acid hydroxylase [Alcanivoracaceae bacterium]|nr:bifunctional 3-(3-hydroxy-phenyl)propionate/3-hydroxycinnamic acid hydroxylase [Alcanivoracaceae bacterium]